MNQMSERSIPDRFISNIKKKMLLAALSLGVKREVSRARTGQPYVSLM